MRGNGTIRCSRVLIQGITHTLTDFIDCELSLFNLFLENCGEKHTTRVSVSVTWFGSLVKFSVVSFQGSYSDSFELFKFHDFPWPFQVFQDLRFSCPFKKCKTFTCLGAFLTLNSSADTNSGVHPNACRLRCLTIPLCLTLPWPCHPQ